MRWTFRQISALLFLIGLWTVFTFFSTYTLTPNVNVNTGAVVHATESPKFKKQSQYDVLDETIYYKNNVTGKKQDIIVIMWDSATPFSWGDGQIINTPNYGGYTIDKGECPVNCIFTTERKYLHSADALLFDTCLTGPTEYREVPIFFPEKREGQHWLWFAYEQQYYFPMMQEETYMSKFDFKMTYHQDSLVHISFTCPWGGLNTFLDPPPPKNKKKLAVLMASNCNTGGATERTEYVKELMKYMEIDSVGHCLHNTDMPQPDTRRSHGDKIREKIGIISEYKFLLAFENNNHVPDYVTEKMTNAYQAGTVPVYWGAPNVDDWVIGEHSIIKTTDYASPKELAEYLNFLNDNDDEYNKYFDWKKQGISPSYQQLLDDCLFYAECRLCKKLATMKNPNIVEKDKLVIKDIDDAWALRVNCVECREERVDQFVYIAHKPVLSLSNKFTLSAWIKLDQIQDGRIIDKATAGNLNGYSFDVMKAKGGPHGRENSWENSEKIGHLRFCGGGGCFWSNRKLYVGIWYFVTATFEQKQDGLIFYINGKKDSSHSPSKPCDTNELAVKFGRASEGGGSWRPYHQSTIFDGTFDDISIWNRLLSEEEIEDMMFRRLSGKEQGLVGYWGFNEGEGNIANDSGPNMLHGMLFNGPVWVPALSKPLTDPSNIER